MEAAVNVIYGIRITGEMIDNSNVPDEEIDCLLEDYIEVMTDGYSLEEFPMYVGVKLGEFDNETGCVYKPVEEKLTIEDYTGSKNISLNPTQEQVEEATNKIDEFKKAFGIETEDACTFLLVSY